MATKRGDRAGGTVATHGAAGRGECNTDWWRHNRSIRWYGVAALAGTQLADVLTTAVGVLFVPTIVEANPVANRLFAEVGLLAGLVLAGSLTVLFAAGAAELFGFELRRRFELPTTALAAQLSIYLALSALFGAAAIYNGLLIVDQTLYALEGVPQGLPTLEV